MKLNLSRFEECVIARPYPIYMTLYTVYLTSKTLY